MINDKDNSVTRPPRPCHRIVLLEGRGRPPQKRQFCDTVAPQDSQSKELVEVKTTRGGVGMDSAPKSLTIRTDRISQKSRISSLPAKKRFGPKNPFDSNLRSSG